MAVNGEKRALGFRGEGRAVKFLKKSGYEVLHRNFRCPFGEVDIIAQKGGVLCFIEVKTRSSDYFGAPNQAVDKKRQSRYIDSARYYFANREIDCTVRFDIIEIMDGKINHIESAFTA